LIRRIVTASNPQEEVIHYFPGDDLLTPLERRHGIPIGNLTSQFLANVMLDPLDHLVKEQLCWAGYLRFADDFLVFGDDKRKLGELLPVLGRFLESFRLKLHPRKCVVLPVRLGVPFLGWRLFADHRLVKRTTGVRFQRCLRKLARAYQRGEIGWNQVRASVASWNGHLSHGDTWGLRCRLFEQTVFNRSHPVPVVSTEKSSARTSGFPA
jgi:hypothetical protein